MKVAKAKSVKTDDRIPIRKRDVLSRRNPDGSVLIMKLNMDRHFFTLEGLAAEFWNNVNGKAPVDTIISRVVKQHSAPKPRFERDVRKLLDFLIKNQLIDLR